jgi:hypothetical protein
MVKHVVDRLSGNGNSTKSEVEITRGLFTASIVGVVNIVLYFSGVEPDAAVFVSTALNPTIVIMSATLFALWDRWYERVSNRR